MNALAGGALYLGVEAAEARERVARGLAVDRLEVPRRERSEARSRMYAA
jgi:hypothetical protein